MSFSGFSFVFWRILEFLTVIPIVGMLAWFVNLYNDANALTPRSILVLFIVSVLAAAWVVGTLFLYSQAKHSAAFVAFVDILFVGAFIGGVYELRSIAHANCGHFARDNYYTEIAGGIVYVQGFTHHLNKTCAMLKASFALGIMNCIFFFITAILALLVHRHWDKRDKVVVRRETHYSRHGHRSHSSRSPRRSSHHSHHSRRGSYV